jgi:hypothetical protein
MYTESDKNNLINRFHKFSEYLRQIRPDLYSKHYGQLIMNEDGVPFIHSDNDEAEKQIIYDLYHQWVAQNS